MEADYENWTDDILSQTQILTETQPETQFLDIYSQDNHTMWRDAELYHVFILQEPWCRE